MCESKCTKCQQVRNLTVFGKLCEQCLKSTRGPSKRKRYESEISTKSGISTYSTETELTDIEDDELECDGPSSDSENDKAREQTEPKTIQFDLQSVGSLASQQRYVNPIEKVGQPVPRTCSSRTSLSSIPKTASNLQIAQAQTKRRRQMRKNYSESDTGGFKQRPYTRRYSADDENTIEELVPHDSIVVLNKNLDNQARVYVAARSIQAVKSDPNLLRINPDAENLRVNPSAENMYDSVKDDDSGYMSHKFMRQPNAQVDRIGPLNTDKELGQQNFCDNCLQNPTKLKWILTIVIVISWAPVVALTALLLGSMPGDPPPTEQPPIPGGEHLRVMEEIINREVDKKIHGIAASSNTAPLRLEGVGYEKRASDTDGMHHTHHRFKWSVPSHFVQNPIFLMPDRVHVRVNMTGYYVVFCRLHYVGNQQARQPFTVQHSLYKVNKSPNDEKLDSVSQHCMFMNDSKIEHTSTLHTLVYLEAGAQVYIRVRGTDFLDTSDYSKNIMGIFILPRVN